MASALNPSASTFVPQTMSVQELPATQETSPCITTTTITGVDNVPKMDVSNISSTLATRVARRPRRALVAPPMPKPEHLGLRDLLCSSPEDGTATKITPVENPPAEDTLAEDTPAEDTPPATTTPPSAATATTTTTTTSTTAITEGNVTAPVPTKRLPPPVDTTAATQRIRQRFGLLPRVVEKFDGPTLNVDKEEFKRDVAKYGLKTLADSIWATDKTEETVARQAPKHESKTPYHSRQCAQNNKNFAKHTSNAAKDTRWCNKKNNTPPRREAALAREASAPCEECSRREATKHGLQAKKDSQRQTTEKKETPPPVVVVEEQLNEFKGRVAFDMDEFRCEVAKQGLKTLKDSRWAN